MCMDIDQQLRRAAKATGLSILQISKQAGIGYQAAHGFMTSNRDIRLSTAAKIAKVIGVELRTVASGTKRKSR